MLYSLIKASFINAFMGKIDNNFSMGPICHVSTNSYTESHTALSEAKGLQKWRGSPRSWIERISTAEVPTLRKLACMFNRVPIRVLPRVFTGMDKIVQECTSEGKGTYLQLKNF